MLFVLLFRNMADLRAPAPGGQDLLFSNSGRDFSSLGGGSELVSSGRGENFGNFVAGAGSVQGFSFERGSSTEKLGAFGQWAEFEASVASRSVVRPNFAGGMGQSEGLELESRTAQTTEISKFLG